MQSFAKHLTGYKIFRKNYTCRGYKYALDRANVFDKHTEIVLGETGFHFCPNPIDCLRYYNLTANNTYAMVESGTNYYMEDGVVCCDELTIVKTFSYDEFKKLCTCDYITSTINTTYKDGEKHGPFREWYENGDIKTHAVYAKYKLVGMCKTWWPMDGYNKQSEIMYDDDKYHGTYIEYHPNGTLWKKTTYAHGVLQGEFEEYYDNTVCYKRAFYVDGNPYGAYNEWWWDGTPRIEAVYENGIIKTRKNYDSSGIPV